MGGRVQKSERIALAGSPFQGATGVSRGTLQSWKLAVTLEGNNYSFSCTCSLILPQVPLAELNCDQVGLSFLPRQWTSAAEDTFLEEPWNR